MASSSSPPPLKRPRVSPIRPENLLSTLPSINSDVIRPKIERDLIGGHSSGSGITQTQINQTQVKPTDSKTKVLKALFAESEDEEESDDDGPKYPIDEDSIVLWKAPTKAQEFDRFLKKNGWVPVVVDPKISDKLFPEQRDGLQFMFDHFIKEKGCILAHEPGVGKTFTTIALIHTLLEQGVESPKFSKPSITKVVIVAPKNLVTNWETEFRSWMDPSFVRERICKTKSKPKKDEEQINLFLNNDQKVVLLMSYENMKKWKHHFQLKQHGGKLDNELDLLIFDEAHRLKNESTKVSMAHKDISFKVKMGLTGTPIQNKVEDLFQLINLVAPGELMRETGAKSEEDFILTYVKPISQTSLEKTNFTISAKDKLNLKQIKNIIEPLMHIRQNTVNVDKHELIVCLKLSEKQATLYRALSKLMTTEEYERSKNKNFPYTIITALKTICNDPLLAKKLVRKWKSKMAEVNEIFNTLSLDESGFDSTKVVFLVHLLTAIRRKYILDKKENKNATMDRVVIVSYRVDFLQSIERALHSLNAAELTRCKDKNSPNSKKPVPIRFLKFYGQTNELGRTNAVRDFNDPKETYTVLLLSSKAGGIGINLTGGNHLVMLDPDWNPYNDEQAMARIWRQGQTKSCYIYRLVCTGTIEERTMDLQLTKKELKRYMTERDKNRLDVLGGQHGLYEYNELTDSSIHQYIKCVNPNQKSCGRELILIPGDDKAQQVIPILQTTNSVGASVLQNPIPSSSSNIIIKSNTPEELDLEEDNEFMEIDDELLLGLMESDDDEDELDEDEEDSIVEKNTDLSVLRDWTHYNKEHKFDLREGSGRELQLLSKVWESEKVDISFVFHKKTIGSERKTITNVGSILDNLVPGLNFENE